MNRSDQIVPIGIPLGIYNGQGVIQNGKKQYLLEPKKYAFWFFLHLALDIDGWIELCMRQSKTEDERACMDFFSEFEEEGLLVRWEQHAVELLLEKTADCAALRQGIYEREDMDDLCFLFGNERLRIPNIPLLKLIWMHADGSRSLTELLERLRQSAPGLISDCNEELASILVILLKNHLIILHKKE